MVAKKANVVCAPPNIQDIASRAALKKMKKSGLEPVKAPRDLQKRLRRRRVER